MQTLQCRKTYITAPGIGKSSLTDILYDVCKKVRISHNTLCNTTKTRDIVEARYIYFYRARKLTNASYERIGRLVNRDHSTVIYGIKQVDDVREIREKYDSLYKNDYL